MNVRVLAAVATVAWSGVAGAKKPAPDPGVACGELNCQAFNRPASAFAQVLLQKPKVLGVGEFHEITGATKRKIPSAIHRFTTDMLPQLSGVADHLVVETWMKTGKCGETEKKAMAAVQETTKRPETTEDEVTTLLSHAYDQKVAPHVLTVDCDEYKKMLDDKGELDPVNTLQVVSDKLLEKAQELLKRPETRMVALYGGALHNDLFPDEDLKTFSYGPQLDEETKHQLLELDLYVPEYIENDDDLKKAPWFAGAMKLAKAGKTVLVQPHEHSFVIVFARTK
jgi:hypothetical protein